MFDDRIDGKFSLWFATIAKCNKKVIVHEENIFRTLNVQSSVKSGDFGSYFLKNRIKIIVISLIIHCPDKIFKKDPG